MDARAFWSLTRDERSERIARAVDTGTCSVCSKPILPEQPRNGLIESHWECGELPPFDENGLKRCFAEASTLLEQLKRVL